LRSRALLDEQELAAGEVGLGRAEQHCQLQREDQIAIEILVQAVVVAGLVFQDQRRLPLLPAAGSPAATPRRGWLGRREPGRTRSYPEVPGASRRATAARLSPGREHG
jgi:hypothetical protein